MSAEPPNEHGPRLVLNPLNRSLRATSLWTVAFLFFVNALSGQPSLPPCPGLRPKRPEVVVTHWPKGLHLIQNKTQLVCALSH